MAAAWSQVGDLREVNQVLAQGQLAQAAGQAIHTGRLLPLGAAELIQITGPAHTRLTIGVETIANAVRVSLLPTTFPTTVFRRVTSPSGPVRRQSLSIEAPVAVGTLFDRLNGGTLTAAPPRGFPDAALDTDSVLKLFPGHAQLTLDALAQAVNAAPLKVGIPISNDSSSGVIAKNMTRGAPAPAFKSALLKSLPQPLPAPPALATPLNGPVVTSALAAGMEPYTAVRARIVSRVSFEGGAAAISDQLDPVMAAPVITTPMFRPLKAISQDLLLPGVDKFPQNSVALAETNWAFVEAYLVGLNYEMGRELLWNEFPTDMRGTYFRQFWDPSGHVPPPQTDIERQNLADITSIDSWPPTRDLGDACARPSPVQSPPVLVIRGELLRRFPNATIYAAQGIPQPDGSLRPSHDVEKFPIFEGSLEPDITFVGFDLDAAEAKASPGWFFVIQQHPTQPHYGLLASSGHAGGPVAVTDPLSWDNVGEHLDSAYAPVFGSLPAKTPGWTFANDPKPLTWSGTSNSAQIAAIALRTPVRIAIHASQLI
jgi:hypothetical protein